MASLADRMASHLAWAAIFVFISLSSARKIGEYRDDEKAPTLLDRIKRSELESEFDRNPESNVTIQQAGVMQCFYEFFVGEGDPVTGRSAGVFTKVKNWFNKMTCGIRGDCEETNPSMIPPVTLPPFNPDAEAAPDITPSSADNDVFGK